MLQAEDTDKVEKKKKKGKRRKKSKTCRVARNGILVNWLRQSTLVFDGKSIVNMSMPRRGH